MKNGRASILYIAHNRLGFNKLTLPHLLESGGHEDYTVTIVDNASTDGTRRWLMSLSHPRIDRLIVNSSNTPLWEVTNRFWDETDAEFIGKVDNDTIMPVGFIALAVKILRNPVKLGAVGAMHFNPLDILPIETSSYAHNIRQLPNGRQVLLQRHLGGCCYLMKRSQAIACGHVENAGYFNGGWTEYQWKMLAKGYPSAYVYPFVFAKHLDDPEFGTTNAILRVPFPKRLTEMDGEEFRKAERKHAASLLSSQSMKNLMDRYIVK